MLVNNGRYEIWEDEDDKDNLMINCDEEKAFVEVCVRGGNVMLNVKEGKHGKQLIYAEVKLDTAK